MVAGKLLVGARYPGTGSVRALLVGRLIRRERSAARAMTNTTSSVERARKESTAIFFTNRFTSETLGRVLPSGTGEMQTSGGRRLSCSHSSKIDFNQRSPSSTATYCRTLLTNAGSAVEWNFAWRPIQSMLFN